MKTTFKVIFWLVILALFGVLIYQNLDYFMTKTALTLDLKRENWVWTIPGLENIYYFAICFLVGLLLAGFKGLMVKWRLKKTIKSKDKEIDALQEKVTQLKVELEVFQHDPYIKKELEKQAIARESLPDSNADTALQSTEPESEEDQDSDTAQ